MTYALRRSRETERRSRPNKGAVMIFIIGFLFGAAVAWILASILAARTYDSLYDALLRKNRELSEQLHHEGNR